MGNQMFQKPPLRSPLKCIQNLQICKGMVIGMPLYSWWLKQVIQVSNLWQQMIGTGYVVDLKFSRFGYDYHHL